MAATTRSYQFTIHFDVDPDHPAYDDPEWAADAAWGALTSEYGLRAIYTDVRPVGVRRRPPRDVPGVAQPFGHTRGQQPREF